MKYYFRYKIQSWSYSTGISATNRGWSCSPVKRWVEYYNTVYTAIIQELLEDNMAGSTGAIETEILLEGNNVLLMIISSPLH